MELAEAAAPPLPWLKTRSARSTAGVAAHAAPPFRGTPPGHPCAPGKRAAGTRALTPAWTSPRNTASSTDSVSKDPPAAGRLPKETAETSSPEKPVSAAPRPRKRRSRPAAKAEGDICPYAAIDPPARYQNVAEPLSSPPKQIPERKR